MYKEKFTGMLNIAYAVFNILNKRKIITNSAIVGFIIFVFQISIFLTSDVRGDRIVCDVGTSGVCDGTNKADYILGTANADDMRGYDGDDNLSGFKGNDFISGYSGADIISGGPGDDTIEHNTLMTNQSPLDPDGARDQITCGEGDDTAFINYSTDGDTADRDCETVHVG